MTSDQVECTKREFEKRFLDDYYYNRQTQDENHKNMLLSSLHIYEAADVLDFGTGSGYLSFALAKRWKNCRIIGLDIVTETLKANKRIAKGEHLNNIEFISYDGSILPFENNSFDAVMSRYVVHHIPNLQDIFHEFDRVLKPGGQLLIADPMSHTKDNLRFIDRYMKLVPDGHIMFYTKEEMIHMANMAGLVYEASTPTKLRFPRKKTEELMKLLESTEQDVKDLYQIEVTDTEVYTSIEVLNISFFKG